MEEIVSRIEAWLKAKNMTPSELAKELQMNRSSVVHMMSGRNKPSLQFIINIALYDPELNLRFLLTGASQEPTTKEVTTLEIKEVATALPQPITPTEPKTKSKEIVRERLIVLKNDGTYDSFTKEA